MATTHAILPTHSPRLTGLRNPRRSRAASFRRDDSAPRPISELDEAHRRMKRNMQALEALLHLQGEGIGSANAETLLTELETGLQAMAADLRSRCRAGDLDQIELALYLRQATRLWNTPPGHPPQGGWCLAAGGSVLWRPESEARGPRQTGGVEPRDLETILEPISPRVREVVRRAVYACAVTFPPWFFDWRSTDGGANPGPRPASELRIRVIAAPEGVNVNVSLSGVGPGLPAYFNASHHRALAAGLSSVLGRLVSAERGEGLRTGVEFEVTIAGSGSALSRSAAA